ncbi:GNAT family N-acetyltransferase [uncultured Microbacterium sp.]|uniref:GNAT family N-acetyltransferase n=1 Tax=uncultured Microbacterium sp. TaxID=191216 RepID=UPI0035C959F9
MLPKATNLAAAGTGLADSSRSDTPLVVKELDTATATAEFVSLLTEELPAHYDEVDETFATNLFRVSGMDADPDGYFTLRKKVFVGLLGDRPVGFTVATFKRGGSVKIGPTAVFRQFRRRRLASFLRDEVERRLFAGGTRKLYVTIANSNTPALMFNLGREFRVEGLLRSQYRLGRDELVLGKFAHSVATDVETLLQSSGHPTSASVSRDLERPAERDSDGAGMVTSVWADPDVGEVRRYLEPVLETYIAGLDASFYSHMVAACAPERQHYHRKGKSLIATRSVTGAVQAIAVFVPKRGGAAKLSPLVANSETALRLLIQSCGAHARGADRHKLYAHVPMEMRLTAQVLQEEGFGLEAQLREPYKPGADVLVFGAELD